MDFEPFKYYGIDWLMFAGILTHLWMLGNKLRSAWLIGVLISLCGILFGYLSGSLATVIMNCVFITIHIRNYMKWSHD
jgi:hypothetical protein